MDDFVCKIATIDDLNTKWDYEIKNHPNDNSWKVWKQEFLDGVSSGNRICFYGFKNGKIITEATAIISTKDLPQSLCDNDLLNKNTAYLVAFRTIKKYQGQGYFSRLYKYMEAYLSKMGFTRLSIGVEPKEVKNILIYFKYGFTNYIKTKTEVYPPKNENEKPEELIVNYYYKNI